MIRKKGGRTVTPELGFDSDKQEGGKPKFDQSRGGKRSSLRSGEQKA